MIVEPTISENHKNVQWSPDIVKVDIVKNPDLVNSGLLTILLLFSSKIRVDIVKNPD